MPNNIQTINNDNVKWFSKKKYPCKRNKGEHEWGEPTILYKPSIRYHYKLGTGLLDSSELYKDHSLIRTEISVVYETECIHCGKKHTAYLSDNINI